MTSAWKRAAVFGSLWAASELVLGNLLHSLRVPLAGTLLAAIGVAILVAGLRLRGGPGVALRAGLVCALIKSVSPGAVIIGPMFGILLEASIVEGVTLLTRRTAPGMLLAGALATATPILQKVGGLVVTYGADAATMYIGLYDYAASALGVRGLGPVNLVLAFVCAAGAIGTAAAAAGLRVASHARQMDAAPLTLDAARSAFVFEASVERQAYSLPLLALHGCAFALGLLLVATTTLWVSASLVASYAALSFLRYRRVAQKFARPRLWIEFAIVAALAAGTLGALTPGRTPLDGLYAGGQMLTRAVAVIVAFSGISVELRNPAVLGWFLRRGLAGAADAVSIATRALPGILRLFGDGRQVLRHPIRALSRSLAATVAWIDESEQTASSPSPVFILSGARGIGKTTKLGEVVRLLRSDGIEPYGFLSPAVRAKEERSGYDLHVLSDDTRIPLARTSIDADSGSRVGPGAAAHAMPAMHVGQFTFLEEAVRAGCAELDRARSCMAPLVIVDEVGPLELRGHGWASALMPFMVTRRHPLILVVRPSLVSDVCSRWNLEPVEIWDASVLDAGAIWTDLRLAYSDPSLYSQGRNGYLTGDSVSPGIAGPATPVP